MPKSKGRKKGLAHLKAVEEASVRNNGLLRHDRRGIAKQDMKREAARRRNAGRTPGGRLLRPKDLEDCS